MNNPYVLLALVGGLLVLVCTAAMITSLRLRKQLAHQYQAIANELGFEVEFPKASIGGLFQKPPVTHGQMGELECSIFSVAYGLDGTRQTDTTVRLQTRLGKHLRFVLSNKSFAGKLGQAARGKSCKTGNPAFDEQYLLKSPKPDALQAWLKKAPVPELEQLMAERTAFVELKEGVLSYTSEGLIYNDAKRREILNALNILLGLSGKPSATRIQTSEQA